ncbi:prephenate dehydrogenase [Capillibacterium thermochitinicola]|uniref:Prephenate dehydrogenase n=1 Tax=Capillibacterium thermochitinicola TaxID=2699427 RepID=A0A8J6LHJ5_9FIRM|nr:prephenate dehydrogenase [Capillibacterium thermochitinicola]MBA2132230.1 prephenate dehydrogenase [Capillibacterium thermochitinicola]
MKRQRIALIGLGLIGGSLGLALCRQPRKPWVVGYDPVADTCREALARQVVHEIADSPAAAAQGADLVVLAVPVGKMEEVVRAVAPVLTPGTILTDVASTKGQLARALPPLLPEGVYYVGGHPMAGSEQSGLAAADPFLFQNAVYLLTPAPGTPPAVLATLEEFIRMVGGLPLLLTPEEHDLMVAVVSHLPHLMAAALVNVAVDFNERYPGTLALAAGGFHDTTRVAMGSPALWREILASNRHSLLPVLRALMTEVENLTAALSAGELTTLEARLKRAATARKELPARRKGFLTLLHELVVVIEDRPGAIAEVIGIIKTINIKDIEILRVREGEGGTLRLAFENEEALAEAVRLLRSHGFQTQVRGGQGQ